MKDSKLNTPHIKEQVVKQLAVGESQNSIAEQVGLNQSQVSRFANREDIKALIEEQQRELLKVAPDAVENVKELVKEMKDTPKDEIKRRELCYKASTDVLKSVGLLPAHVQSQTFINMYQDNRAILSPKIIRFLQNKDDDTDIPDDVDLSLLED